MALCEIEMYGFLLSARSLSKDMDFNYGVNKASMEANGMAEGKSLPASKQLCESVYESHMKT